MNDILAHIFNLIYIYKKNKHKNDPITNYWPKYSGLGSPELQEAQIFALFKI